MDERLTVAFGQLKEAFLAILLIFLSLWECHAVLQAKQNYCSFQSFEEEIPYTAEDRW